MNMPNTPNFKPKLVKSIAIVGFDDAQLLDITGPLQVFASANEFAGNHHSFYNPFIVAENDYITTTSGVALYALPVREINEPIDTLIVSGGRGIDQFCKNKNMLNWLKNQLHVRRIASVCSGAFALAEIGVLSGLKATTHWCRCNELQQNYPNIDVHADAICIKQEKIWTSAGITSGVDMSLAMVEEDFGIDLAKQIARQLVVYLRRSGGQDQFSTLLNLYSKNNQFNELAAWITSNLTKDLRISRLAEQVGMSVRNFTRLYTLTVGYSPAKAVTMIRHETAKQMLELGKSVKETARLCGFKNTETMRLSFIRHIGISPQAYKDSLLK